MHRRKQYLVNKQIGVRSMFVTSLDALCKVFQNVYPYYILINLLVLDKL